MIKYIKIIVYLTSCSKYYFLYNKRAEEAALGVVNDSEDDDPKYGTSLPRFRDRQHMFLLALLDDHLNVVSKVTYL